MRKASQWFGGTRVRRNEVESGTKRRAPKKKWA